MTYLSRQEVFNKVYKHLLTQNTKSLRVIYNGNKPVCTYRGENGTMCAAGCLIKDEFYSAGLENLRVRNEDVQEALNYSGINLKDLDLVAKLQDIHDHYPASKWKAELKLLAVIENLDIPEEIGD